MTSAELYVRDSVLRELGLLEWSVVGTRSERGLVPFEELFGSEAGEWGCCELDCLNSVSPFNLFCLRCPIFL